MKNKCLLIIALLGLLFFSFLVIRYFSVVKDANAISCTFHTEWSDWKYHSDVIKCVPDALCGTTNGVKTIKEYRKCERKEGCDQYECWPPESMEYKQRQVSCEVPFVPCPIDGGWCEWSDCSAICGGGTQTRVCECPKPEFGGKSCCGERMQECNVEPCNEEGVCPTDCGQPASEVPDGEGGVKKCPATELCPEPTPIPEPEPRDDACHTCSAVAPDCTDSKPGNIANIYVDGGVSNDNCVEVRWIPAEGASQAHIRYSEVKDDWRYALLNTNNDGVEEICGLQNGVHYWFQVSGVNGCAVGDWSVSFDPLP